MGAGGGGWVKCEGGGGGLEGMGDGRVDEDGEIVGGEK